MGYVMNRQIAALTLFLSPLGLLAESEGALEAAASSNEEPLPLVKLSPRVREQDRGRSYYQSIECTQLGQADAHSSLEKQWLEERKAVCLERYRAFSPRSYQR